MTTPTVTVIGLGLMGRPMARSLMRAGFDVRGWNRSPLAADLAADIPRAGSLEDAAQADVCLLMLANQAAVDSVVAQLEPHLIPGRIVLDMSTSDLEACRAHAARLAERGVGWVDAPVSGGPEGASKATLAIMAGGDAAHVGRVLPLLKAMGGNVVHVGPAGSGYIAKYINQVIVALTIEAVAEALTLAEKNGIDPRLVQSALRGGFADSVILQIHGSRMARHEYVPGGRVLAQLKDLRLAQRLAQATGLSLPHLDSVAAMFTRLVESGDGDLDHSAVHKLIFGQG